MSEDRALHPPQNPFSVGLRGRCPRCGEGRLFAGFLRLEPRCRVCGLDLAFADSADGPAVFIILIVGFVVAAAALLVEVSFEPAAWVHVILWGPLVVFLSLALLRPFKGVLIALQYAHKAQEGEIDRPPV
ncbi:DUF983 domain-containing protein [Faunimonas sp. B44]|uniref:DUF983 domain-containing protein n=1 Tax=Faunimonas sp. B44 TaxID=3461493 RepID=UPI0040441C42